jgi:hypothetical protein
VCADRPQANTPATAAKKNTQHKLPSAGQMAINPICLKPKHLRFVIPNISSLCTTPHGARNCLVHTNLPAAVDKA